MSRAEALATALAGLEERLDRACRAAGRKRTDVVLVAVSKTHPLEDITALADLGVTDFGENRDQEARGKAAGRPDLRWHFVGGLQTNKARSVATYAAVVHSVDRPELVAALSAGAVRAERELDVLVQISLDTGAGEQGAGSQGAGRQGAGPAEVPALADAVAAAPGLRLGGVMAVAPLGEDPAPAYARLADLARQLRATHPGATAVSAGMSGDLEQAVAAGATYVRVGTALFGPRPPLLR